MGHVGSVGQSLLHLYLGVNTSPEDRAHNSKPRPEAGF